MSRVAWMLLTAGLVVVSACGGVNEENFTDKSAKVFCAYQQECYRSGFVDEYKDMPDCVDEYVDDNEDYFEDLIDDCDFDKDKAKDCLDSFKDATDTCDSDDIEYDDCYEIWDC